MKDVVVIGLGNPLMKDEGIGVHLIKLLIEQNLENGVPPALFLDLGTSAVRVLHAIAGKRKAIFVDCALMGESPGTIRRFIQEEVKTCKKLEGISLHEGDLLSTLELSRALGECPQEVVIFGIEPEEISPGEDLSKTLQQKINEYLNMIKNELD